MIWKEENRKCEKKYLIRPALRNVWISSGLVEKAFLLPRTKLCCKQSELWKMCIFKRRSVRRQQHEMRGGQRTFSTENRFSVAAAAFKVGPNMESQTSGGLSPQMWYEEITIK